MGESLLTEGASSHVGDKTSLIVDGVGECVPSRRRYAHRPVLGIRLAVVTCSPSIMETTSSTSLAVAAHAGGRDCKRGGV